MLKSESLNRVFATSATCHEIVLRLRKRKKKEILEFLFSLLPPKMLKSKISFLPKDRDEDVTKLPQIKQLKKNLPSQSLIVRERCDQVMQLNTFIQGQQSSSDTEM